MKISFLIAAHNEEKTISKCLENLINLPYKDFEILIGLDGCTDKTETIVKEFCKKSKKIQYFSLNLRQGKPAVINKIIKKSTGEIIIINDCDWIFRAKRKEDLLTLLNLFKSKKVGGIAESFPVELKDADSPKENWVYEMVKNSSFYWLDFQKKHFCKEVSEDLLEITEPGLHMTNIFRRELYQENTSLADDFERTRTILKKGFKIYTFRKKDMPRMIATYDTINLKGFLKQKMRTSLARDQIVKKENISLKNYYLRAVSFMLRESFKKSIKDFILILVWLSLTTTMSIISKIRKMNTTEGWRLRAKR